MAIALNCRCGKQFNVDDRFGGKRNTYASPWVGGKGGNSASIGSPGSIIVGSTGRTGGSGNVCALGAVSMRLKE